MLNFLTVWVGMGPVMPFADRLSRSRTGVTAL
jgi:hypothetical protein